ncbi:flagellar basal body P-ring protein FlgI [Candidatus Chrysopegis kryptomonas]|uniref:Flagellar P-ring protein n=1 Tax=Candidatus Chryseopegocella kryptomonas TaxID=1633643 RepID=A0A0P1MWM9_9BACT|nr:flagellar basal body P-ring protein FlgI [Candidatus Chrysopegis kryptomonas]CUT00389.1 flagellar P-ring protein precursor FlgI [Candidatus Chrysopegis kryptomonas]
MRRLIFLILLFQSLSFGTRIKDIAYVKGVSGYQVIGYGLVVGLNGTGDTRRASFTVQSVVSMLKKFGITVTDENLRMRNVAAVMVTAFIPPFAKEGASVDVIVSSIGDATSLHGGNLLMTPLVGSDGVVYAVAQGPISVGGFDVRTAFGTEYRRNVTTTGRVPNGAIIEKSIPVNIASNSNEKIELVLRQPDFTTAKRIADAVNLKFNSKIAFAIDASSIFVKVPEEFRSDEKIVDFISQIELIDVQPDAIAKVVINERTGTIVVGENVTISPVAISHGAIHIEIQSVPVISQPAPFSRGQTVVTQLTTINVYQDTTVVTAIEGAATVQDIAKALNALKVLPRDIIAIFQALKESGALKAELIIM